MSRRNLEAESANRLDSFSAAAARALAPGEWLTFAGRPGLRLLRNGASRMFQYRYRSPIDGRLRKLKIGRWPATSWEKAVAKWEKLAEARDEGRDPQGERKAAAQAARASVATERSAKRLAAVTVERVGRVFLSDYIAVECKTEKARYDVLRMLESRVFPVIGDEPAQAITRPRAKAFLLEVKSEAPSLARLLRSRLGGAWDHAIDTGLLPDDQINPWRGALVKKLKGKPRSRFLDDRELVVFLEKVAALPDADVGDALLLTLYTAARSGEVVGMEWPAVDLERGTWTIGWSKTGLSRTIRLSRQSLAILEARGRGFEIPQQTLSMALREAKHFGLRPFTAHDLRRSARTGFSRLGVRDEVAEAALGHVEGGIRGVYNLHAYEREVGEALQLWADHLSALAAPEVVPMTSKTAARRG